VVLADVVSQRNPLRHDPKKLSATLIRLLYDKGQARSTLKEEGLAALSLAKE